ncbi:MAG: hypothetical protein ACJ764_04180 [Solirubrobacteraceae bacterium]
MGALPAAASAARHSTSTTTPACSAPALAQIYSWAQDTNWYAAIPGEKWDSFSSGGWTLSGGAKFVTTTLADGKRGTMLYMPSGAKAVSPSVCVTNSYPAARTEIRNEKGTAGVSISVAYMGAKAWGANQLSGTVTGVNTGWTLPVPFNIFPSSASGWQLARFTLVANGSAGVFDISNFYVDPRMH